MERIHKVLHVGQRVGPLLWYHIHLCENQAPRSPVVSQPVMHVTQHMWRCTFGHYGAVGGQVASMEGAGTGA
eukprot:364671-Chlamydomonas_euryale.AAC.13